MSSLYMFCQHSADGSLCSDTVMESESSIWIGMWSATSREPFLDTWGAEPEPVTRYQNLLKLNHITVFLLNLGVWSDRWRPLQVQTLVSSGSENIMINL